MEAKLLISLLGTIMILSIYGHPTPENESTIPEISTPAESLKEAHAKTNTSNSVPTEDRERSKNEEQSQEKSNRNSKETQAQANANPIQPAVMTQTNDQPSDGNKQQQNLLDVITAPQQVQQETPNRPDNSQNAQLSQQQQQQNRFHFVIPAPSNQLRNYFPFPPLYFNSSQSPSQLLQPLFIFGQPPFTPPMLSFPPPMMFPSQQFPPPAFITAQPGTKTQYIPRPLQPNQQLGGTAQPNQLPIFYVPPNIPNGNLQPPFPMVFGPPATHQLPQFVLHNQQTSPSDTVIGQSSVYLGQPNQNQEFILIRTK